MTTFEGCVDRNVFAKHALEAGYEALKQVHGTCPAGVAQADIRAYGTGIRRNGWADSGHRVTVKTQPHVLGKFCEPSVVRSVVPIQQSIDQIFGQRFTIDVFAVTSSDLYDSVGATVLCGSIQIDDGTGYIN